MTTNLETIVTELKHLAPRLRDYEPSNDIWQQVQYLHIIIFVLATKSAASTASARVSLHEFVLTQPLFWLYTFWLQAENKALDLRNQVEALLCSPEGVAELRGSGALQEMKRLVPDVSESGSSNCDDEVFESDARCLPLLY